MKKFCRLMQLMSSLWCLFSDPAHALPVAQSTFDTDDEGWTAIGDPISPIPEYFPAGGNPGGYITVTDAVTGIPWFWQAPPKFLGDISAVYGQLLTFDLKQSATDSQFAYNQDVILSGDGITRFFDTPYNPDMTWTSYAVPLNETAGWGPRSNRRKMSV